MIQKDGEDSEDVKKADETKGTEAPPPQPTNKDEDTSSEIKSTHGKVEEASKEASIDKDDPVVSDEDDQINPSQGEEEALLPEKSGDNEPSNDDDRGLMPFLIGGGLAIAGTVAGIALHNNGQNDDKDKRRKDSRS